MLRATFCAAAVGLATSAAAADLLPPPATPGVPIPDGQVAAAVSGIDALVADVMARTGVPGIAVAIVTPDGTTTRGYGVREAGKPATIDPDTVFQLASMSKPLGATVVATQVTAGKVGWDTPMTSLLPWFALKEPAVTGMLTIGDLYSHRSGLPDHAGDQLEDLGYDRRGILERLRELPLDPFRDSYAYTNFGLTAAAEAVAAAAGTDWESLSESAIYRPLGMTATSSRFADYMARPDRAVPHVREGDAWVPRFQRDPDAQSPAGGVSSTASDMARWMRFVLDNGVREGEPLVATDALMPALTPQSVASPPASQESRAGFYGFGFDIDTTPAGRVRFDHSGAFALGASTTFSLLPSAGVGITVLTNGFPVGAPETIALAFLDLVQFGHVTRDWYALISPYFVQMMAPMGSLAGKAPPEAAAPAAPLDRYAGTYQNPYFGPIEIAAAGDVLTMTAGPKRASWTLGHWDGDVFAFEPQGENANAGSRFAVTFQPEAGSVTIEYWDEEGLGTFRRGS